MSVHAGLPVGGFLFSGAYRSLYRPNDQAQPAATINACRWSSPAREGEVDMADLGNRLKARKKQLLAAIKQGGLPPPEARSFTGHKLKQGHVVEAAGQSLHGNDDARAFMPQPCRGNSGKSWHPLRRANVGCSPQKKERTPMLSSAPAIPTEN